MKQPDISPDMWHVVLDAIAALQTRITAGGTPWDEYQGGDDDPKTIESGYRSLISQIETAANRAMDSGTPAPTSGGTRPASEIEIEWEQTDTDYPGDQNADSQLVPDGCTGAYYSLGVAHDDLWGVELIGLDHGDEVLTAVVHLGYFRTEEEAKDAAQQYERRGRSTHTPLPRL